MNEPALDEPLPELSAAEFGGPGFHETWIQTPCPAVVRGGAAHVTEWTIDNLMRRFPDTEVVMTDFRTGRSFDAPLGEARERTDRGGQPPYIHNCEQLLARHPELYQELDLGRYADGLRLPFHTAQLFMGLHRGSGTPFHCANNYNVFLQLEGRKRWTFVDPNYTLFLYPYVSENNAYQGSAVGWPSDEERLEQVPLYGYCPRYVVELEPGDLLLNPPWWYHAVENLTETSVAVSTRWLGPYFPPIKNTNRLFTFLQFFNHRMIGPMIDVLGTILSGEGEAAAMQQRTGLRKGNRTVFEDESHDRLSAHLFNGRAVAAWT